MGKYGIGARVRDEDGDEGVIIDKRKGEREVKYEQFSPGFSMWWSKGRLTVVIDGLSIGDRVRATGDRPRGEIDATSGTAGEPIIAGDSLTLRAGAYYKLRNGDVVGPLVDNTDGSYCESYAFYVRPTPKGISAPAWMREGAYWRPDLDRGQDQFDIVAEVHVPVAAQALTIEAGKFYRTRDGRKAETFATNNTTWPFYHDVGGYHAVSASGKSCIKSDVDDLVAEWVDPVVETAQPKFKKGDRVRSTERGDDTFGMIGTVYLVDSVGDVDVTFEGYTEGHHGSTNDSSVNHRWFFDGDNLELAQAPVTPLPAVGTKVTLTGTVTGHNPVYKTNINVVVDGLPAGRNSLGIPPSALKAA